jgi:hypothetical protein
MVNGIVLVDSSTAQMIEKWFHFHENSSLNIKRKTNQDPHYFELLGTLSVAEDVKNNINRKGAYPFKNIPTAVLTAENHQDVGFTSAMEKDWGKFQSQLAKISINSYQLIAYQSGHFIQMDQPKLVIDTIYTLAKKTIFLKK